MPAELFSPNYSSVGISIKTTVANSMRNQASHSTWFTVRWLTIGGLIPGPGLGVGLYRGVLGVADIFVGVFNNDMDQARNGAQNVIRGTFEAIPTVVLILGTMKRDIPFVLNAFCIATAVCGLFILVGDGVNLKKIEVYSKAPLAAYYDGVCVLELSPKGKFTHLPGGELLELLEREGTRTSAYNKFV